MSGTWLGHPVMPGTFSELELCLGNLDDDQGKQGLNFEIIIEKGGCL